MGESNQVREALRKEVLNEFNGLKTLTIGTKEHTAAVEDLTKLYGLIIKDLDGDAKYMEQSDKIELEKSKLLQEKELKEKEMEFRTEAFNCEQNLKEAQFEAEMEFRMKELEETKKKNEFDQDLAEKQRADTKKDNIVDYGIRGVAIVAPLIFYGIWLKMGMKFEENGTFTSATFKGFFNKIKPTRID